MGALVVVVVVEEEVVVGGEDVLVVVLDAMVVVVVELGAPVLVVVLGDTVVVVVGAKVVVVLLVLVVLTGVVVVEEVVDAAPVVEVVTALEPLGLGLSPPWHAVAKALRKGTVRSLRSFLVACPLVNVLGSMPAPATWISGATAPSRAPRVVRQTRLVIPSTRVGINLCGLCALLGAFDKARPISGACK